MTNKKEKILNTALELFANDSYNTVSTSKIAKQAGVSEGLIFRHFKNKKGLLDALLGEAEQRLHTYFMPIIIATNPKLVIKLAIGLPFMDIDVSERHFWKLQFKLKWEAAYNKPEKMKPLLDKLTWAFSELGYAQAEQEAYLLSQIIDSISIGVLRDGIAAQEGFRTFLLEKYKL